MWKKTRHIFGNGWVNVGNDADLYFLDDQTVGSPNWGLWYVSHSGKDSTKKGRKWFKTKSEAIKYAKDYMKKYPRG